VKSYDQNQNIGKLISGVEYKSGNGFEYGNITGTCNKIIFKPSNNAFKVQGGVSASSRTNRLRYNTIISHKSPTKQAPNYAIVHATLDSALNGSIKDLAKQDCYILNRATHTSRVKMLGMP
jgi:hypothetical protein